MEPVTEEGSELDPGRMPLLEHLKELRKRLIRSLLAIGAGFLIAYGFAEVLRHAAEDAARVRKALHRKEEQLRDLDEERRREEE